MRWMLMLVTMIALSGCTSMLAGTTGGSAGSPIGQDNRSAATLASDDRITAIIRDRYAADAELRAANLLVQTRQGTVTLRGTLSDFADRDRAVRLANDVVGVVRVHNQISVRTR